MNWTVLLCACAIAGLPSCGDEPAGTFDREAERVAVLRALLIDQYSHVDGGGEARRFVLDPTLGSALPILRERDEQRLKERGIAYPEPVILPDGRKARRPRFDGLDEGLVEDWSRRTALSPTPPDLGLPHPVDWFTSEDWEQLKGAVVTGGINSHGSPRWTTFHIRHPDSAGWINLSDVGFSRGGQQALVYVAMASGSLGGSGRWFLLSKREGSWIVDSSKLVWRS